MRFLPRLLSGISLWVKRRAGRLDCPCCGGQATLVWEKDWVMHPEEPPLFCHWRCLGCHAITPIRPTELSERAVRSLGFGDFTEYATKVLHRGEGDGEKE